MSVAGFCGSVVGCVGGILYALLWVTPCALVRWVGKILMKLALPFAVGCAICGYQLVSHNFEMERATLFHVQDLERMDYQHRNQMALEKQQLSYREDIFVNLFKVAVYGIQKAYDGAELFAGEHLERLKSE